MVQMFVSSQNSYVENSDVLGDVLGEGTLGG